MSASEAIITKFEELLSIIYEARVSLLRRSLPPQPTTTITHFKPSPVLTSLYVVPEWMQEPSNQSDLPFVLASIISVTLFSFALLVTFKRLFSRSTSWHVSPLAVALLMLIQFGNNTSFSQLGQHANNGSLLLAVFNPIMTYWKRFYAATCWLKLFETAPFVWDLRGNQYLPQWLLRYAPDWIQHTDIHSYCYSERPILPPITCTWPTPLQIPCAINLHWLHGDFQGPVAYAVLGLILWECVALVTIIQRWYSSSHRKSFPVVDLIMSPLLVAYAWIYVDLNVDLPPVTSITTEGSAPVFTYQTDISFQWTVFVILGFFTLATLVSHALFTLPVSFGSFFNTILLENTYFPEASRLYTRSIEDTTSKTVDVDTGITPDLSNSELNGNRNMIVQLENFWCQQLAIVKKHVQSFRILDAVKPAPSLTERYQQLVDISYSLGHLVPQLAALLPILHTESENHDNHENDLAEICNVFKEVQEQLASMEKPVVKIKTEPVDIIPEAAPLLHSSVEGKVALLPQMEMLPEVLDELKNDSKPLTLQLQNLLEENSWSPSFGELLVTLKNRIFELEDNQRLEMTSIKQTAETQLQQAAIAEDKLREELEVRLQYLEADLMDERSSRLADQTAKVQAEQQISSLQEELATLKFAKAEIEASAHEAVQYFSERSRVLEDFDRLNEELKKYTSTTESQRTLILALEDKVASLNAERARALESLGELSEDSKTQATTVDSYKQSMQELEDKIAGLCAERAKVLEDLRILSEDLKAQISIVDAYKQTKQELEEKVAVSALDRARALEEVERLNQEIRLQAITANKLELQKQELDQKATTLATELNKIREESVKFDTDLQVLLLFSETQKETISQLTEQIAILTEERDEAREAAKEAIAETALIKFTTEELEDILVANIQTLHWTLNEPEGPLGSVVNKLHLEILRYRRQFNFAGRLVTTMENALKKAQGKPIDEEEEKAKAAKLEANLKELNRLLITSMGIIPRAMDPTFVAATPDDLYASALSAGFELVFEKTANGIGDPLGQIVTEVEGPSEQQQSTILVEGATDDADKTIDASDNQALAEVAEIVLAEEQDQIENKVPKSPQSPKSPSPRAAKRSGIDIKEHLGRSKDHPEFLTTPQWTGVDSFAFRSENFAANMDNPTRVPVEHLEGLVDLMTYLTSLFSRHRANRPETACVDKLRHTFEALAAAARSKNEPTVNVNSGSSLGNVFRALLWSAQAKERLLSSTKGVRTIVEIPIQCIIKLSGYGPGDFAEHGMLAQPGETWGTYVERVKRDVTLLPGKTFKITSTISWIERYLHGRQELIDRPVPDLPGNMDINKLFIALSANLDLMPITDETRQVIEKWKKEKPPPGEPSDDVKEGTPEGTKESKKKNKSNKNAANGVSELKPKAEQTTAPQDLSKTESSPVETQPPTPSFDPTTEFSEFAVEEPHALEIPLPSSPPVTNETPSSAPKRSQTAPCLDLQGPVPYLDLNANVPPLYPALDLVVPEFEVLPESIGTDSTLEEYEEPERNEDHEIPPKTQSLSRATGGKISDGDPNFQVGSSIVRSPSVPLAFICVT